MTGKERRDARRALRWLAVAGTAVLTGAAIVLAVVILIGGRMLNRLHEAPGHSIAVPADSAAIAEGGRLAAVHGCLACHGADAGGERFAESVFGDRIVAPNLTHLVRVYDDRQLDRSVRHGVKPDGRSVAIMPSRMFSGLSDSDLGRIIAFLHSLPQVPDTLPSTRYGLLARWLLLTGQAYLEADSIDQAAPHPPLPPADTLALGAYLARTSCTECHGHRLQGDPGYQAPDLRVVAHYDTTVFQRLLRQGLASDGTERGLMTSVSLARFRRFSDSEIGALYAFLRERADSVVSEAPTE